MNKDTTPEDTQQHFSIMRVFHDPSSGQINNGFFNGTFFIAAKTTLSEDKKELLLTLITVLSMKLSSLWEIKEQYNGVLKKLKNELREDPKGGNKNLHNYSIQATELLGWFDVFLVQIKSILDHLVKIPSPVFGYNRWSLASYGGKGEKVKRAFKNLPKKYIKQTSNFYDETFGKHPWIQEAIELRDKLNHGVKGGLNPKLFTVSYDKESGNYIEPMWSDDQTIEQAINRIFFSTLNLSSMFSGLILSMKLPDELTVYCDGSEEIKTKPVCILISKVELKRQLESQGIINRYLGSE